MNQPLTLVHQLKDWAKRTPDAPAIHGQEDGKWIHRTWKQYDEAVTEVSKGLIALGHQVGECVAIVGDNRIEWVLSQFGIMSARGIPAPIYATNTEEQTAYIVSHSKSKIAFCDNQKQLTKYLKCIENGLMSVEKIITMDDIKSDNELVMSLSELRKLGREQDDTEYNKRIEELTDTETSLLIYTSGTTGVPKAVQLDHGGMIAVGQGILERFPEFEANDHWTYRAVSYLPLCHVAEQLFTNLLHLGTGGEVYFCPDISQVKNYLPHARPTLFLGVPRVWEKFQAVLEARLAEATGIKAKLASWALKTELNAFKKEVETGRPVTSFSRNLANKLVISKIKEKLGLDKLLVAATGAAPIGIGTLEFFASLGITVYEGYGMSETTGVATCAYHRKPSFGTVGKPLNCTQVKIADDDEILLKGRNMTRGYLYMPEQTKELIDEDGWIHTGDLGSIDEEGNIRITGRKKDLIITAGGKNVAPAEMEAHMKQILGVGQAVVVGDRQPYLCALVTLDPEALPELAKAADVPLGTLEEMAKNEKVKEYFLKQTETECNAKVARYQTIKKIDVLPVEFTVEGDEVTPTMKIKRNVVNKKYAENIDKLYA